MGWYDIYPFPPNTPAPYNDESTYGRVAAWGYADIVESSVPDINAGQTVYGFLPISSAIETVRVEFASHAGKRINDQIIVLDEHRQHLWKIYNRYQICSSLPDLEKDRGLDSLGWDALMQGLFATGYNLSTFGFAWTEQNRIHPSGKGECSSSDADLRDAAIVVLNASGKTGMSFAYALRHNRPKSAQPKLIVGVGSSASVDAIRKSSLFDTVALNSEHSTTASTISSLHPRRIVLLDFGARPDVCPTWSTTLSSSPDIPFTQITIGGEVAPQNPETAKKRLAMLATTVLVNASLLREKGIESGGESYFEGFYEAWEGFKRQIKGMGLEWGEGVQGWEGGWEGLCRDEVRAGRGLVFRV